VAETTITPYLGFDGNCREAFEFYAKTLGGKIESLLSYGESPMCAEFPPEMRDRVMHACLTVGDAMLMGGDATGPYDPSNGFMVALEIEDTGKAERVFGALGAGGRVTMPWAETFWVERFGMVTDRFGISWAVNGGASKM
jgi:PhnB protein